MRAIACAVLFGACVSPEVISEQTRRGLQDTSCATQDECEAMWSAAIAWISRNSMLRFETQGDYVVTTTCPISTALPCYDLNWERRGGGAGRIAVRMQCVNPFGCPLNRQARAELVDAIVAARNRVRESTGYAPPAVAAEPADPDVERHRTLVLSLSARDPRLQILVDCGEEVTRYGQPFSAAAALRCYDERTAER